MSVLKSEIRNKYSTIPNSVIRAKDLSDAEYRLLIYLYSLPNGWKINQSYLGNELSCSRININKKLRRIKELGYLEIIKEKDDKSIDYIYLLKEKSVSLNNVSSSDVSLNDVSVSDTYINTNIINTEIIKKDITITTEGNTIFDFIEQNFGRTLSSIEYQKISEWEDNKVTRHAIEIAVLNRSCNIPYIEAILSSYRDKGIKTVEEAIKNEQEFQEKKKNNRSRYKSKSERIDEYCEQLARERGEL